MARFIDKLILFPVLLALTACGDEGGSSQSVPPVGSSSSGQSSPIALNTPTVLQSDSLIFWNAIGEAEKYEVYKGEELISTTTNNSYEMTVSGAYKIKAIPSSESTDRTSSKLSNEINYEKLDDEDKAVIDVKHDISTFATFDIAKEVEYVVVDYDGENPANLYNFGFAVANRTKPLTIEFPWQVGISNRFPEKYFISYSGRQIDMPLLTIYFPHGGSVVSAINDVDGSNGAYNDSWMAGYGTCERGGDGGNGNTVASLNNIAIKFGADLLIRGGRGSNGGNGGSRQTWGNAGDGGNGGNGAPAFIMTDSIYEIATSSNIALTLEGGKGGNAGQKGGCSYDEIITIPNIAKDGRPGNDAVPYTGRLIKVKYPGLA